MKYTSEILIQLPIQKVLNKLQNYNDMKHWQRGFENFEHVSGEPGALGSKMKLNYKFGSRKFSLLETITYFDFPNEYHLFYDSDGLHNIHKNSFTEVENGITKWVFECECIPTTFSMSVKTLLMPGIYKKQILQYIDDFKNFAEKGVSIIEYA